MHSLLLPFLAAGIPLAKAAGYSLKTSYQGDNFFNQWNFSTEVDVNYGNVLFQSLQNAQAQQLVYINDAGNAVLKVDNKTVGNPNDATFGRNSVYLTSNVAVDFGSLILFDAVHIPFGCSVWPGFFTLGAGVTWPQHGEIDIIENVNQATTAQYSLHTLNGCKHPADQSGQTGTIVSTDCFNQTNGNQGCITREAQQNSFGAGFNNNGGGAYATQFNTDGIKIWFFPRANIPSDFGGNSPNPDNWGVPSAYFPSSSCNMEQFFGPQTMILEIDICGSFALGVFSSTCQGNCLDLVRTPTNYDQAYWEIKSLKVFTNSSSSGGGSGDNGGTTTSNGGAGPTNTPGSGAPSYPLANGWMFGVGIAGALTAMALGVSAVLLA